MTPWVVKLGGSVYKSLELSHWLDVIAGPGAGKAVLVPGGGPWADQVRAAQKIEGFDDRTAHRKALLAMEQYGHVLAGLRSNLAPACSVAAITEVLQLGKIPVWMPYAMVVDEPSIEESWDVTSDSLAAWLASRLHACGLLLIKSIRIEGHEPGIEELMRRGWVDPAFGRFASVLCVPTMVFGQGGQDAAAELFSSPSWHAGMPGLRGHRT